MLYLSRFIYNYYIVFFKKTVKKARKRAKNGGVQQKKKRNRYKPIPLPCSLAQIPLRTKLCNVWRLRTLDIMRLIFREVRLELHFCDGTPASVEHDYYTASAAICKLAKLTIFDEIIRENNYR